MVAGVAGAAARRLCASGWSSYLASASRRRSGRSTPCSATTSASTCSWPFLALAQRLFCAIALLSVGAAAPTPWPASACGSARGVFITESARGTCRCSWPVCCCSLALGDWLRFRSSCYEPSGIITGPSYADVHARMPALRVLAGVGVLGALLAVVQAFSGGCGRSRSRSALVSGRLARRHGLRHDGPALLRRAQRAGARNAVHRAQHRGHARRLRARRGRGARAVGRRDC